MKKYGGVDVEIHVFMTSALVEVRGRLQTTTAFIPGKQLRVFIG
jgi:hypothetical protein